MHTISSRAWTIIVGTLLGLGAVAIVVSTQDLAPILIALALAIAAGNLIFQRGRGLISELPDPTEEEQQGERTIEHTPEQRRRRRRLGIGLIVAGVAMGLVYFAAQGAIGETLSNSLAYKAIFLIPLGLIVWGDRLVRPDRLR